MQVYLQYKYFITVAKTDGRHPILRPYEKQHKEGTCKVSGRSVVFSAFYADLCLCPKLVIITTLKCLFYFILVFLVYSGQLFMERIFFF